MGRAAKNAKPTTLRRRHYLRGTALPVAVQRAVAAVSAVETLPSNQLAMLFKNAPGVSLKGCDANVREWAKLAIIGRAVRQERRLLHRSELRAIVDALRQGGGADKRIAVAIERLQQLSRQITKRKDARGGPADPEMQAFTDAVTRLYAQHGREFLNTRNYMPAAKALLKRAVNRQISGVALRMPPGFNWKLAVAPKDRSYDPLLRRCVNEARSVSRTAS